MRTLTAALRIVLFLILFLFALKNHELATLKFYFDLEWKAPLVLLLLIFFAAGVAAGVLACLPRMFRQRREHLALAGQLKTAQANAAVAARAAAGALPADAGRAVVRDDGAGKAGSAASAASPPNAVPGV